MVEWSQTLSKIQQPYNLVPIIVEMAVAARVCSASQQQADTIRNPFMPCRAQVSRGPICLGKNDFCSSPRPALLPRY